MHLKEEIVKRLYRTKTITKYKEKDIYLCNSEDVSTKFLFYRIFSNILVFVISFILLNRHISIALLTTILFNYILVYFKYDSKIKEKEKLLERDSNLFFEVLLITLKSGKNLNQALELTVNNVDNTLSDYFRVVINETKYGKTLHEALIDFKDKISSDEIKNIITDLTESYVSGRDMISSLEKDIVLLNNKRIYNIKTYINKLPIKISAISVFLLIPLMLLLILSPIILEYFG